MHSYIYYYNGNCVTDITKFCSNEFTAISNRCYLYLINYPLCNRKIFKYAELIKRHKHQIMCHLYVKEQALHKSMEFTVDLEELKGYSGDED